MKNLDYLNKPFEKMGAELETTVSQRLSSRFIRSSSNEIGYSMDIRDGIFKLDIVEGENPTMDIELTVVDVDVKDRHLLLNVTEIREHNKRIAHKFLCGHDERDWFVAAVPESAAAKNVAEAKHALKPKEVRDLELGLRKKEKNKRKNKARIRQGEWFFLPVSDLVVDENLIHKNEPLSRGNGSKPHMVDEIYRTGGKQVYVCGASVIEKTTYENMLKSDPSKAANYRPMTQDASVYARGNVRHADHATIYLVVWHRVLMNTEGTASFGSKIRFLD